MVVEVVEVASVVAGAVEVVAGSVVDVGAAVVDDSGLAVIEGSEFASGLRQADARISNPMKKIVRSIVRA